MCAPSARADPKHTRVTLRFLIHSLHGTQIAMGGNYLKGRTSWVAPFKVTKEYNDQFRDGKPRKLAAGDEYSSRFHNKKASDEATKYLNRKMAQTFLCDYPCRKPMQDKNFLEFFNLEVAEPVRMWSAGGTSELKIMTGEREGKTVLKNRNE